MNPIKKEIGKFLRQRSKNHEISCYKSTDTSFDHKEAFDAIGENLRLSNKRLQDANRELNTILNKIEEALFSIDVVNNKVTQISIACEKICGYTPLEFKANPNLWNKIIYPEDLAGFKKTILVLWKGQVTANELRITHRNKSIRWIEIRIIPSLNDQGKLFRVDGIAKDITQKKLSEEKNREIERRYRLVSENPILGIGWCSTEGNVINANDALCKMLDYSPEEIIGKHFSDFSYAADLEIENPLFDKLLNKEIFNYQVEKRYIKKNKALIWVLLNLSSVLKENGEIEYFIGIVHDITKRKQVENELKKSYERTVANEKLMRNAEKLALFGSWEADIQENIVKWSSGTFRIFGYESQDIEPTYELFLKHIYPDDLLSVKKNLKDAVTNHKFQKFNFRIVDCQGRVKHIHSELIVEINAVGDAVRLTGFNQDITEKVILEKRLAEEKKSQLRQVTRAVITAQENERTFLAEELHDNINPILATAKLYMDCAISNKHESVNMIKESKGFIRTAMNEIRKLSKSLVPPSLGNNKLVDVVHDLIENINRVNELEFVTEFQDFDETILGDKLKLTIYRIIQEQFNNVLKHAKATTVIIAIRQHPNFLELSIKDDGIGLDKNVKRNGLGLQNITNRAELFNGKVKINSEAGQGFELSASFAI